MLRHSVRRDVERDRHAGARHRRSDQVRIAEELGQAVDERLYVVAERAGCDGAGERCMEERFCGVDQAYPRRQHEKCLTLSGLAIV